MFRQIEAQNRNAKQAVTVHCTSFGVYDNSGMTTESRTGQKSKSFPRANQSSKIQLKVHIVPITSIDS